ncbi:unnamed protein product [Miscanthus lutarioriparius]|uniref:Importin subunit beta-1/Transportin-1-like TPR repeats domain-containing protein n=1 Tax=Miscanthus lutarioriparius TaxID=422564 RepID=A0A811SPZ4_9POAL|nr:unnamed protein product [Miscanthus lutarioriparius]
MAGTDAGAKAQIKGLLLQTLTSPVASARSSQMSSKQLLKHFGYLCEEVSPDAADQDQVNKILTAVVQGMNASEANSDVRLAATRALYNALGFAQVNFSNDMERDYIMRVVCEATQSPEVKIRQAAFECLVAISSTYYDKLATYMQDIFNITAKAVRGDEESVALQAIEFWSSICDEEIDILDEYCSEFTADSDVPCYYFIKQALPALVPMLLETLLKQEEDQDLDEGAWNLANGWGTCLGLVARTVGDDIVPLVMPFVEENITKSEWRQREAATYAFGSILEGPSADKLAPLVNVALGFMLSALMKDPTLETPPIITAENCQQYFTVLLHSMKDVPNVAEKACGALYFLAQGYVDAGSASPLSPFFQDIVQNLLMVTHREDAGESRLLTAAYETLNEVVRCSTEVTAPIVMQLVPVIMVELHQTLETEKLSTDEREKRSELQGLLCGCLQLVQTLQKYMAQFYQYLEMGLQNFEEYQLRNGILEAYSGILQGFKSSPKTQLLMPYAPHIIQFLDALYNGKDMDDTVMKTAIGVLGDLADTLGVHAGLLINQSTSSLAFLEECLASDDPLVKESAEWARIAISRAVSG